MFFFDDRALYRTLLIKHSQNFICIKLYFFFSNTWMRHFINGTAIDTAIQDGYKGDKNCSNTYSCQLNQLSLEKIMKKITKNVNRL